MASWTFDDPIKSDNKLQTPVHQFLIGVHKGFDFFLYTQKVWEIKTRCKSFVGNPLLQPIKVLLILELSNEKHCGFFANSYAVAIYKPLGDTLMICKWSFDYFAMK